MKVVVIGGTGLIGRNMVTWLAEHGHEAVPAAPSTGVDTVTGEGLKEVLQGADVVVDVSNSPSFADDDVMAFFRTSTGHLVDAAKEAGADHYVALSVVGTDRQPGVGYFRAKLAQEELIAGSGLPYSIVRATQFFEFATGIADGSATGGVVRLPGAGVQPMAAAEVSAAVGRAVTGEPSGGVTEVAGPEVFGLDEWVRTVLTARSDPRPVVTDPRAPYFGAVPGPEDLLPGPGARLSETTLARWLART
ncbi:SDR family oxidoreductase [Amycolatopsis sp. Hca4]|uniref:SDR family oxidoreductase n=1 Tax=Amycolatopsis sp. Hca4 TaxID=2742131 RepID=UPI0015928690|nr:NAD(P)H-binding protein [Amycolatopsis sp. Hca4]QKV80182.1 NAD(P)H-binding protein [Amycolatopsis sp. Hca4]